MTILSMTRGDTPTFTGTVSRDGNPVDLSLTNTQITFTAKFGTATVTKSNGGGGISVPATPPKNTYQVLLSTGDTNQLEVPVWMRFDIQLTEPDGRVTTVDRGTLFVATDVTV